MSQAPTPLSAITHRLSKPFGEDGCHFYRGELDNNGYGVFRFEGNRTKAHRAAYLYHHGLSLRDIKGKHIKQTCCNRACCNPSHLHLYSAIKKNYDNERK